MTAFENFVNLELPRRSAFLTPSVITGSYDGDPNDVAAPNDLKLAPVGTWYLRETPLTQYRKLTAGATGWVEQGDASGGGSSSIMVQEALTIPIDQKGGNVRQLGDPTFPVGTKFQTQAEVDAALGGADTFEHWMDVLDALAGLISPFRITLDATGITDHQFARPGDNVIAFDFSRTTFIEGGGWSILGPDSSTWPVVNGFSAQTITAVQTGSNDPFITTSGTPYTSKQNAMYYARISTGQLAAIHNNDTDTIRLVQELSPAPVPATDTFDVVQPFQLINTTDGVNRAVDISSGIAPFLWGDNRPQHIPFNQSESDFGNSIVSDLGFNGNAYNGNHHKIVGNGDWELDRVMFDHTDPAGFLLQLESCGASVQMTNCTRPGLGGPAFQITSNCSNSAFLGMTDCAMRGNRHMLSLFGGSSLLSSTVLDGGGELFRPAGIVYVESPVRNSFIGFGFSNGVRTILRNDSNQSVPGLHASRGTRLWNTFWGIIFENCDQQCVLLERGAILIDDGSGAGLLDGGGNLDVGIEVQTGASLALPSGGPSDVAGANGAVRIGGVVFNTIGDVLAAVPVFNLDDRSILEDIG